MINSLSIAARTILLETAAKALIFLLELNIFTNPLSGLKIQIALFPSSDLLYIQMKSE